MSARRRFADTRVRISQGSFAALNEFCATTGLTKFEVTTDAVLNYLADKTRLRHNSAIRQTLLEHLICIEHQVEDVRFQLAGAEKPSNPDMPQQPGRKSID